MPALRTALEMALTAVNIAFINCVRSPVAEGCFRCSANNHRVRVMQSVSISPDDIFDTSYAFSKETQSLEIFAVNTSYIYTVPTIALLFTSQGEGCSRNKFISIIAVIIFTCCKQFYYYYFYASR